MADEPRVTPFVEEGRYRGVENSIRDIMSKNYDVRKTVAEETFKRNNPDLFKNKETKI